jgi:hypothetical protein
MMAIVAAILLNDALPGVVIVIMQSGGKALTLLVELVVVEAMALPMDSKHTVWLMHVHIQPYQNTILTAAE